MSNTESKVGYSGTVTPSSFLKTGIPRPPSNRRIITSRRRPANHAPTMSTSATTTSVYIDPTIYKLGISQMHSRNQERRRVLLRSAELRAARERAQEEERELRERVEREERRRRM